VGYYRAKVAIGKLIVRAGSALQNFNLPNGKRSHQCSLRVKFLSLPVFPRIVSVPDEKTQLEDTVLYACTDDPNEVNRLIVQENNPMKFFQTIYQETRQIYLRHGKWHNYLLHFSIWQDTSFSTLHLKRGMAKVYHTNSRKNPTNKSPVESCSFQYFPRQIMPFMSSGRREYRTYILSMSSLS
jgi:hypothetical protein